MSHGLVSNAFPANKRLRNDVVFKDIYNNGLKKVYTHFVLFYQKNGYDWPRLGVVVTKKNVRHAVDRNRLKRMVRESFRCHQQRMANYDIIVVCRYNAINSSPEKMNTELEYMWAKLTGDGIPPRSC